jgi:hypothetical protein
MVQPNDIKKAQRELVRKKRRGRIRLVLTLTLLVLGTILIVGIVVGTILELGAFTSLAQYKDQIHEFTRILFTSCVGLLCLVLGFERLFDFDKIEETLENQNQTLATQNAHFASSTSTLTNLSQAIQQASMNSKSLVLKVDELTSQIKPPTVLKDINWKSLIKQADEIDFLVQGWDGWMEHHSTELEDFFRRNGKFHLIVVNAEGEEAGYVRKLMERRLEKTASQVEAEITTTISNIYDIYKEVTEPSPTKVLEVFCLNEVNWYFAAQFKSHDSENRDVLVLSLYSHHRYLLKETPAIVLFRDSAQSVFKWFDAELKNLEGRSTKLNLLNDVRIH